MGWIPLSIRSEACSNMDAARTTTPVVPSPISSSWDFESSTRSFATLFVMSIYETRRISECPRRALWRSLVRSNLAQDSCTVIGDRDISIGGDQDLVETTGSLKILLSMLPLCHHSHDSPSHDRTRELFTMFATVLAATMCDLMASVPCCLFFFPWL